MTARIDFHDTRDSPCEWLLANGLGGFAMGAAGGMNTRRYHGLLIAALRPPVRRVVAVHSLMEEVVLDADAGAAALTLHPFGEAGELHPTPAADLLRCFVEPPYRAVWTFRAGDVLVEKTIRLEADRQVLVVEYEVSGTAAPLTLRVRPLTPLRDFHELSHRDEEAPSVESANGRTAVVRRGEVGLRVSASDGRWTTDPQWWHDLAYEEERRRGQSWREDVWSAGQFDWPIGSAAAPQRRSLEFRVDAPEPSQPVIRRSPGAAGRTAEDRLEAAAEQFVVHRIDTREAWSASVIAGYPWFADWGRDSMIALRGLLLSRVRVREAVSVLRTFSRHLRRGLLVNRFDDYTGEPHHNTVDASLWFVIALWECAERGGGGDLTDLIEAARTIVNAYRRGTEYAIGQDHDGLIAAGSAGTQLTWMDAARDGIVFTPRHGKAIEINALWHSALRCLADLTPDEDEKAELRERAGFTAFSMQTKFWWPERACCHDVLVPPSKLADGEEDPSRDGTAEPDAWTPDGRLRPNQILAVSLPHSALMREQQRSVVEVVGEHLLTPYGLRTLEPGHADYRGRYEGNLLERDAAYHNGTVWPWLIGPYCEAVLRTDRFSDAARGRVRQVLGPLLASLDDGCLGQIAEVYDGDAPHRAGGCPAQAWSVAEVMRILRLLDIDDGE